MSPNRDELAALARRVRQVRWADGSATAHDDLAAYETGPRGRAGRAAFVARPRDIAEVREVLRWAYAHHVRLVPRGGGAGRTTAALPDASGEQGVIDLRGLSDDPVIDPAARTITAPAGATVASLADALAPYDLTLPFAARPSAGTVLPFAARPSAGTGPARTDPGTRTVGGLVGDGFTGRRTVPGGGIRAGLLGVAAVLADAGATPLSLAERGASIDSSDPSPLFIGAQGTLGVVTGARFAVVPRPVATAAAVLTFADDASALTLFDALHRAAAHLLTGFEVAASGLAPAPSALIRLADVTGDLPMPLGTLLTTLVTAHAGAADIAWLGDGEPEPPWPAPDAVTTGLARTGTVVELVVSVPRERVPRLRADTRALAASVHPGARVADLGDALDGRWHLYVTWPGDRPEPEPARLGALVARLHDVVVYAHQGTVAAAYAIGPRNEGVHLRLLPPAARRAALRVKDAFDPRGLLGVARLGPVHAPVPAGRAGGDPRAAWDRGGV